MGKHQAVPIRWMAPETLRYTKFSTASDVWAYGVTLWEIYTLGERPYFQVCNENVPQEILNGLTLEIPDYCPENIKTVMMKCWRKHPDNRCSFEDIVSFIKKRSDIQESNCSGPINDNGEYDDVVYDEESALNHQQNPIYDGSYILSYKPIAMPMVIESPSSCTKRPTRKAVLIALCIFLGISALSILVPVVHYKIGK